MCQQHVRALQGGFFVKIIYLKFSSMHLPFTNSLPQMTAIELGRTPARSFLQSPTHGCRAQGPWASFCCFPRHQKRQLIRSGIARTHQQ